MMTGKPSNLTDVNAGRSCEVRLGLVMYGGVSLAIYINGVAQEFFRAVRGRNVFKLVKALTDSDIVVDIISGTSAGGVNGIMLAYALCNEKEFSASSVLWRQHGDIRLLLRSPHDPTESTHSLLNSEGYYQPRLEEAFRYMPVYVRETGEIESKFSELDLFVTGTDVDGKIYTQFDDAGHPIDVKDHRSVFLLKHRRGRKEPFCPQPSFRADVKEEVVYKSLAKLARLTSCFPAAFAPVRVTKSDGDEVDKNLQEWGRLNKESSFLDGGIIDNKPFTYTLKEIFYRGADREINRKLFYVEPDPEHFIVQDKASQPNFLQAIIASLIGIPGYESISDDLKLLATHNSKINQYRRFTKRLSQQLAHKRREQQDGQPPRESGTLYWQSRLISLSDRVVEGILKVDGREELLNPTERRAAGALFREFDRMVEQLKRKQGVEILEQFDVHYNLRRLYRMVYLIRDLIYGSADSEKRPELSPERAAQYHQLWQALNTQIDLLDILRVRTEELLDELPIDWKPKIQEKLENNESITPQVREIWELVRTALNRLLNDNKTLRELVPQSYTKPDAGADWISSEVLSKINRNLKDEIKAIAEDLKKKVLLKETAAASDAAPLPPLLGVTSACERDIIRKALGVESVEGSRDELCQAYQTFDQLDEQLFPLEMMAALGEKDIIETIRISPRDARRGFSDKGLSDKVSGDALYHFGGFFKRSWRSNDILWGRLDCVCQLVETLLTEERVRHLVKTAAGRRKLRSNFFTGEPGSDGSLEWKPGMEPSSLFPHSGQETQKDCRTWIEQLLSEDAGVREKALERFDEMVGLIIEAAQLEIIYEELPNVLSDALGEQTQWNQFRLSEAEIEEIQAQRDAEKARLRDAEQRNGRSLKSNPLTFRPAGGRLDPFVAVIAAAGRASEVMQGFEEDTAQAPRKPSQTKLGRFFTNQYQVGTEELLRDMPVLVLLEILSVSLLVLRNCVLNIFRATNAEKVKNNPIYVVGVDYPLRAFHAVVFFLRRAPNSWIGLQVGAFVLSVFALMVGTLWWNSIIYPNKIFHTPWFIIFIAAPLSILIGQVALIRQKRMRKEWVWLLWSMLRYVLLGLSIGLPVILALIALGELSVLVYKETVKHLTGFLTQFGLNDAFEKETFEKLVNRLAQYSLLMGFILIVGLYFFSFYALTRLWRRQRVNPDELKKALINSFSFDELDLIVERLRDSVPVSMVKLEKRLERFRAVRRARRPLRRELLRSKVFTRLGAEDVLASYFDAGKMELIQRRCTYDDVIERGELKHFIHYYFNLEDLPEIIEQRVVSERALTWPKVREILDDYFDDVECGHIKTKLVSSGILDRERGSFVARLFGRNRVARGVAARLKEQVEEVLAQEEKLRREKKVAGHLRGKAIRRLYLKLRDYGRIRWTSISKAMKSHIDASEFAMMVLHEIPNISYANMDPTLREYLTDSDVGRIRGAMRGSGSFSLGEWQEKLEGLHRLRPFAWTSQAERRMREGHITASKMITLMLWQLCDRKHVSAEEVKEALKPFVREVELERITEQLKADTPLTYREWQKRLETFKLDGFSWVDELMKVIAGEIQMPLSADYKASARAGQWTQNFRQRREAMATMIVSWAKSQNKVLDLDRQMRIINPQAMFYL